MGAPRRPAAVRPTRDDLRRQLDRLKVGHATPNEARAALGLSPGPCDHPRRRPGGTHCPTCGERLDGPPSTPPPVAAAVDAYRGSPPPPWVPGLVLAVLAAVTVLCLLRIAYLGIRAAAVYLD